MANVLFISETFLKDNNKQFSLGGSNNLDISWQDSQWLDYYETHKGNYQELNLDLDL